MSSKKVNIISGVGLTVLSITAFVLAIAGCDKVNKVEVEASVESNFEVVGDSFIESKKAVEIVDKETGVSYLLVSSNHGMAITPLYNADGTLKIEGGNENE